MCRKEVTGRFVTGLSGFHPTVAQMGFLLGKMALGQAFLRALLFPRDKYYSSKPPVPICHQSLAQLVYLNSQD